MGLRVGIFLFMIMSITSKAQNMELLNVEFSSTINNSNSIGLNNASVKINLPLKLKKGVLTNSILFSFNEIDYNSDNIFNTSTIKNYKTIKYSLGFLNKINDKWKFRAQISPTISSNFESNISFNDTFLNGAFVFIRANNESKLQLGLMYNYGFGTNKPIPVISYSNKINNNIAYTLGVPITKIEYIINSRNSTNLYLKPKGFYTNLSNNLILNSSEVAEKAKYRSIISGVKFLHRINDFWKISLDAGYQISSKYELLNNNESVYEFETKNNFFIGLNLKLDLINKKIK